MVRIGREAILGLLLGGLFAASAPALSGGLLQRAGHRPFAPTLGDWEGADNGFHASFKLVRNQHNALYGAAPYGIYDLVLSEPDSCPVDSTKVALLSQGSPRAQVLVSHTGTFPYRQGNRIGTLTGTRSAIVTASNRTSNGQGSGCTTHLRWQMRPGHRLPVADGHWMISFSDGEHQDTTVSDGGRASSLGLPNVAANCAGTPGPTSLGGIDLFIPANRRVDETLPESGGATLQLLWTFTTSTAGDGSFTASKSGCQPQTLSFVAQHQL